MTTTTRRDEGIDLLSLGAIPFGIFTTVLTIAIAVVGVAKFDDRDCDPRQRAL